MGEMRVFDPSLLTHTRFTEEAALLDHITAFDGLGPTQLVRKWTKQGGGMMSSVAGDLIDKLELHPDANATDTVEDARKHWHGLQGAARYVANPCVQKAQYPGLYVGGPLMYQIDQRTNVETIFQTLTRVHSVGDWTATGTNVTVASTGDAQGALRKCRPVFRQGTEDKSPFQEDWPHTDTFQAVFRHWAHESKDPLLALTDDQVRSVLAHHAPAQKPWRIGRRIFEIDPETNGGVFTVECVAKTVYAPQNEADLGNMPYRLNPAEKIRVRPFGLASDRANEAEGEGFYYRMSCEWWDIDPSCEPKIRWPGNVDLTNAIVKPKFNEPTVISNDRHWTVDNDNFHRPWWRIVDAKVTHQDDGLLSLNVVWEKPEITNEDKDVLVEKYGGSGWGIRTTQRLPTVPTEKVEQIAASVETPVGNVPLQQSVNESQQGYSDIDSRFARVWGYTSNDKPGNMPVYMGFEAPDIEYRPGVCSGGGGMVLTFYRVARGSLDALLNRYTDEIVRNSPVAGARLNSVHVREDEDGSLEVRIETTTRKFTQQFGSLLSSDYFTNVYRIEYDGLNIDVAGRATDEHGQTVVLKDALGNVVPMTGATNATIAFRRGVSISVQYQRDAECKYHVVVTTEVAVARHWTYSYRSQSNGHPIEITMEVWRNWDGEPAAQNAQHGRRVGFRMEYNRYGLVDAQCENEPDLHEESAKRESDTLTSHETSTTTHHAQSPQKQTAQATKGRIESIDNRQSSDGLWDSTLSVQTAKSHKTHLSWDEQRGGHTIHVDQDTYQNHDGAPPVPQNKRTSVSANVNQYGLSDANVHSEDDLYVKTRRQTSENKFTETSSDTTNVNGSPLPDARFNRRGYIVTHTNDNYTDGKHDTTEQTVHAKPAEWRWTWQHMYRPIKGQKATAYGYGYRNQTSPVEPPKPSDGNEYVYQQQSHWTLNEFDLYDGTVTFTPTFAANNSGFREFYPSYDYEVTFEQFSDGRNGYRKSRTVTRHYYFSFHTNAISAAGAIGNHTAGSGPNKIDQAEGTGVHCIRHASSKSPALWQAIDVTQTSTNWADIS